LISSPDALDAAIIFMMPIIFAMPPATLMPLLLRCRQRHYAFAAATLRLPIADFAADISSAPLFSFSIISSFATPLSPFRFH